jgi:hypothetical protein
MLSHPPQPRAARPRPDHGCEPTQRAFSPAINLLSCRPLLTAKRGPDPPAPAPVAVREAAREPF